MLAYFCFEETGAEGEGSEENLAHWGSGPELPLAKSEEDGEKREARNSKWPRAPICAVDSILW